MTVIVAHSTNIQVRSNHSTGNIFLSLCFVIYCNCFETCCNIQLLNFILIMLYSPFEFPAHRLIERRQNGKSQNTKCVSCIICMAICIFHFCEWICNIYVSKHNTNLFLITSIPWIHSIAWLQLPICLTKKNYNNYFDLF